MKWLKINYFLLIVALFHMTIILRKLNLLEIWDDIENILFDEFIQQGVFEEISNW